MQHFINEFNIGKHINRGTHEWR